MLSLMHSRLDGDFGQFLEEAAQLFRPRIPGVFPGHRNRVLAPKARAPAQNFIKAEPELLRRAREAKGARDQFELRNPSCQDWETQGEILHKFERVDRPGQLVLHEGDQTDVKVTCVTRKLGVRHPTKVMDIRQMFDRAQAYLRAADQHERTVRKRFSKESDVLQIYPLADEAKEANNRFVDMLQSQQGLGFRDGIAKMLEIDPV